MFVTVELRDTPHAWHQRQGGADVGARGVHLHVERGRTLQLTCQVVRRIHRHDAALVDDDHPVAGLGHFRKDVRAQHDRVSAGETTNQIPRLDDLFRVQARGGFVEDQHLGVVQQRLRQTDTLFVPLRQARAVAIGHVINMGLAHRALDLRLALGLVHRGRQLQLGDKGQILLHRHVGVQGRRFRQVPDAAFRLDRLRKHIKPGDRRRAIGGRHVPGQHAHGRGFAGSVGSEKSKNFALFHTEADIVNRRKGPVAFREVLDLDHRPDSFDRVW